MSHFMFQTVSKMKALKKDMRRLMWEKGDLHERVNKLSFK